MSVDELQGAGIESCMAPGCSERVPVGELGDRRWLLVIRMQPDGTDEPYRTFCSFKCLSRWADWLAASADATAELAREATS